jgi:hypothetical protein
MEEDKAEKRFLSYVDKQDNGCWLWKGSIANTGYGCFRFNGRICLSHRASWCIFNRGKKLTPGLQVAHSCGIRDCVAPHHLSEKTPAENAKDKIIHGKDNSGEKCNFSKLNWVKVEEIRKSDKPIKELASAYAVSKSCISNILKNKTWILRKTE